MNTHPRTAVSRRGIGDNIPERWSPEDVWLSCRQCKRLLAGQLPCGARAVGRRRRAYSRRKNESEQDGKNVRCRKRKEEIKNDTHSPRCASNKDYCSDVFRIANDQNNQLKNIHHKSRAGQ